MSFESSCVYTLLGDNTPPFIPAAVRRLFTLFTQLLNPRFLLPLAIFHIPYSKLGIQFLPDRRDLFTDKEIKFDCFFNLFN